MLIHSLCEYYDMLAENNKVTPPSYSEVSIHYLVSITPEGKLDGFIFYQDKHEIKVKDKIKTSYVPKKCIIPKRTQKTGIDSNTIEHRGLYLFGLNLEKNTLSPDDRTSKAKKSHEACVKHHLAFLDGMDSPLINAFRKFLENWEPEKETENKAILSLGKEFGNAGFAFCLSGSPDHLLHDEPQIRHKWEHYLQRQAKAEKGHIGQCAVYGEKMPISRVHDKIKGIYGGTSVGSTLVGCNNPCDESYGAEQSYNSNISEMAMSKYTTALNYILSKNSHRLIIDDTTVLFWAMDPSEAKETDLMALLTYSAENENAEQTEAMIRDILRKGQSGILTDGSLQKQDDSNQNDFYILGIKPNVSRVSMQFFYRKKYADLLWNVAKFQSDIKMYDSMRPVSIYRIRRELLSPMSSSEKINPALTVKLFESILYDTPLPTAVFETILRRCKTDRNINGVRAGILKAYINRKEKKEEITMSLNKENTDQAYLCGRLFAVLERIQESAHWDKKQGKCILNRTIKDSYFASAASKPSTIFPQLIKLSQYHISKFDNPKEEVYYQKIIGEIMGSIKNEFPKTLLLADQGRFMVGYYQQRQDFFTKHEKESEDK